MIRLDDGRHILGSECDYELTAPWTQQEILVRPVLFRFIQYMEKKLKVHDREKGRLGWREDNCTEEMLFQEVHKELAELYTCLFDYDWEAEPSDPVEECADAANFLMMIGDRVLEKRKENNHA